MTPQTPATGEGWTVADVLDRAADLIEPEGAWTQGAFSRNADGSADADEDETTATAPVCWCALGALAEVVGADTTEFKTFLLRSNEPQARARIFFQQEVTFGDVADWNDDPDRTQPEVVAKLRQAAAVARERGL